ncbi:gamma-glutamyltransferase family protein [Pseudonocardia sp. T1-2H]|uniref:gamma-glutamyltransferase family protein n=1 Tax=Pseudonocardia sp. T1-2H TaxID=3128899 RepID=UPI003101A0E8
MTLLARRSSFPVALRPAALGADGMVAASHPAISRAGADVLADGGTAIDAALAMAAVSWLALPGQCGVGGDAFALVHEPDGTVRALCGSGFGPDGGTPEHYAGMTGIPRHGAASVAAPGAIAALEALHSAGATRSLADLWAPAVRLARLGLPCTAKTAADIARHAVRLAEDPDTAGVLLRSGRAPEVGTRLPQPLLAASIERLAADPGALYRGDLAERAVSRLTALGAPFSGEEWATSGDVRAEPALRRRYRDRWVHQTPMPTPGWMVLDQLAVCERQLGGAPLSAEAVHWLAGAARIAFADRYARAGSDSDGWRRGGQPDAVEQARDRIRTGVLPGPAGASPAGDTTSMVAVDGEGRAVSLIHSLAFTFGAGITIPGTGIVLNNRLGRGAYLVSGHPNEVRPRRRPLHTLNAWLVTDDDGRLRHVGNTPGGDGQVQWNTQLLSHLLDHGADAQSAVDAPRFSAFPGSDAEDLGSPAELRCEDRLGLEVLAGLRERGHTVVPVGDWGAGGSAQIVSLDHERGCLSGGSDSRQEGVALGV